MGKDYLAVMDIGTQSSRVIVFDTHGNVISQASRTAQPYYSQQPGWAEMPSATLAIFCTGLKPLQVANQPKNIKQIVPAKPM